MSEHGNETIHEVLGRAFKDAIRWGHIHKKADLVTLANAGEINHARNGKTLLSYAIKNRSLDGIKVLLENGAKINESAAKELANDISQGTIYSPTGLEALVGILANSLNQRQDEIEKLSAEQATVDQPEQERPTGWRARKDGRGGIGGLS